MKHKAAGPRPFPFEVLLVSAHPFSWIALENEWQVKHNRIEPIALHRLLIKQQFRSAELEHDVLTLTGDFTTVRVELASATLSSCPTWLVLKTIILASPHGSFALAGLTQNGVSTIVAAIQEARRHCQELEAVSGQAAPIQEALIRWDALAARDAYLTHTETQQWRAAAPQVIAPSSALIGRLPAADQHRLLRIVPLLANPQKVADRRNAAYVRHQLHACQPFFDTVESNPLTDQQRQAIVHDEDNALVIAGAGTGKTSTVVCKVGFILKKGWGAPEEILLLAFTKKAAEEMQERNAKKLGVQVQVRTFHALGLEIVAQAQGRKPSLCPEAEDPKAKAQTLKALIARRLAEEDFRQNLLAFQSSLRRPYKPAWEFHSQSDYTQYLLDVEPRALSGRLLKSYEECEIANWLLTHGIRFDYERPYEVDTATPEHRQYKPDFYLPDYDLYIEHWGVNRSNETAPFVPREPYLEKMRWARAEHAQHGTKLVETYSWQQQEGVLLTHLETKLREYSVVFHPLPLEEALELLNQLGQMDPFVTLVGTFLSLFKSAGFTIEDLRARLARSGDSRRGAQFLRLFEPLFEDYEAHVHREGEIDFDDMITQARAYVETAVYKSKFRYILVDEFQDISLGRAKLIQALRNQVAGAKVFCVGDDWQSIYRFTGSDIALTTAFETHFGRARKTALDHTFRFHDKIANFSSRFVQANPSQLRKQLSTATTSAEPGVVVWMREEGAEPLGDILSQIDAQSQKINAQSPRGPSDTVSVFLLSRYTFTAPANIRALQGRYPRLVLRVMTTHASKGLEADYVVVDGLTSGKYGFPSEIADDPVLGIVLADGEPFEFAEERRLFYVALTRAKKRVYLVVDATHPSRFVREILADSQYEKTVEGTAASALDACPVCQRGRIVRREGDYGVFYGCSNYPLCCYRGTLCPRCKQGRLRENEGVEARCVACDFTARTCPRCQVGVLVIRRGTKSGRAFWACSAFGRSTGSCAYKEWIQ